MTSRHSRRVWLASAWSFKLYDIRRWNCHDTVHSKEVHVSARICQVVWCDNKGERQTCYKLGCVPSYQSKVLVPRQRTVRQETTMAQHGALPEYLYPRHLEVGVEVNLNYAVHEDEGPHEDLNEHEVSEEASDSDRRPARMMKVVTKKLNSGQMTTIPRASKMN